MVEDPKNPLLTPDEENNNDESSSDDGALIDQNYMPIAWEKKIQVDEHDLEEEIEIGEGSDEHKTFRERMENMVQNVSARWLKRQHEVQKELEDDFEHFRISKQHTRIDENLHSWGETGRNLGPIERAIVAMMVLKAVHLHRNQEHFHKFLSEGFSRIAGKFEQHATTIATQYLKHSEWGTVYNIVQNLQTLSQLPQADMLRLQQSTQEPHKMTAEEQAQINTLVNFVTSQGQWQDRMMEPTGARGPGM